MPRLLPSSSADDPHPGASRFLPLFACFFGNAGLAAKDLLAWYLVDSGLRSTRSQTAREFKLIK
jgi:hypothetical protein